MNLDTIDFDIDCRQWCSLAMEMEVGGDGTAGPSWLRYYKHQTASHSLRISVRQRYACVFLVIKISVHVFLKTKEPNASLSMNIVKPHTPGYMSENWPTFFWLGPNLGPKPSKAHLWHFLLQQEAVQAYRVSMTSIGVFHT